MHKIERLQHYRGKRIGIVLILTGPKRSKNRRSATYIAVVYRTNWIISVNYRVFKEGRKLVYCGANCSISINNRGFSN